MTRELWILEERIGQLWVPSLRANVEGVLLAERDPDKYRIIRYIPYERKKDDK